MNYTILFWDNECGKALEFKPLVFKDSPTHHDKVSGFYRFLGEQ